MLISQSELSIYAKTCTTNDNECKRAIREAEMFDIVPKIGASLYNAISTTPANYTELLDGGVTYDDGSIIGGIAMLIGLKTAIAYYAEARIATGNNVQLDRYGATLKQNEYGTIAEAERYNAEAQYLRTCADKAMDTCIGYIHSKADDSAFSPYIQRPRLNDGTVMNDINFINPD